jgi:hypothetical protein
MFVYVPSNMLNLQIFTPMQKKIEFFFAQNSYIFLKQLKKGIILKKVLHICILEQDMRKLEALKVRGVQRGEKKAFCKLKSLFSFLLFFHSSFSFAFQR